MARVGANPKADPGAALRFGLWAARDRLAAKKGAAKGRAYRRVFVLTAQDDPTGGAQRTR